MKNVEKQKSKKEVAPLRGYFHVLIHELLKTGKQFTYNQIGCEYNQRFRLLIKEKGRKFSDYEDSMHKAMSDIIIVLKNHGLNLLREGCNRKGFSYSYPDGASNVIEKWLDEKSHKRMRLTELVKLFALSKGLLPDSWIVNLIPQIEALEDIKEPNRKLIEFDYNNLLTNIYKIPDFLEAIQNKKVLSLINNAGYNYNIPIIFIPYYIKEYNHRFFCIGLCIDSDGTTRKDYVIAIDRVSKVQECTDFPYVPQEKDYSQFFSDIVGVRHEIDFETGEPMKKQHILIETRNRYTHGRIITKPFHASQVEVTKFGEGENGMGMVSIDVIPNLELTSLLLSFGSNIKVIEPMLVVERIANNARKLTALYDEGKDKGRSKV